MAYHGTANLKHSDRALLQGTDISNLGSAISNIGTVILKHCDRSLHQGIAMPYLGTANPKHNDGVLHT
jgi:hypothetical protein